MNSHEHYYRQVFDNTWQCECGDTKPQPPANPLSLQEEPIRFHDCGDEMCNSCGKCKGCEGCECIPDLEFAKNLVAQWIDGEDKSIGCADRKSDLRQAVKIIDCFLKSLAAPKVVDSKEGQDLPPRPLMMTHAISQARYFFQPDHVAIVYIEALEARLKEGK